MPSKKELQEQIGKFYGKEIDKNMTKAELLNIVRFFIKENQILKESLEGFKKK